MYLFFFNDTATTEIYTLSLHDALPIYSSVHYPTDYGFITETLGEDGDSLDVLVLVQEPTFPGCLIPARPLGGLDMHDEKGSAFKVLAVPIGDPRYAHVRTLADIRAVPRLHAGRVVPVEAAHVGVEVACPFPSLGDEHGHGVADVAAAADEELDHGVELARVGVGRMDDRVEDAFLAE